MLMDPQTVATTWRLAIVCATAFFCWLAYWDYRKKRLQFDERRIAIENGIEPPPFPRKQLDGWPGVKQREAELKAEERRLRIEKGLPVQDDVTSPKTRSDYMRRGLVGTALGAGLALAYAGLAVSRVDADGTRDALAWCIGLAPIVFLYGVANLIYQRYVPTDTHNSPAGISHSKNV
jgi:hypothetical protein